MAGITRRQIFNYAVLPGFRPRVMDLFVSGFHYIPYFIALVYQSVRLLPAGHPYTDARNLGRFGIRHVVGEAANNLIISRNNIDQILLFVTILFGLALAFAQIAMVAMSIMFQPVMAQIVMPTNFKEFFIAPDEKQDLANIFLDLVFGVDGVFNSCVADTAVVCQDYRAQDVVDASGNWILDPLGWPFPIHTAMHQMFQMYSQGLLVVGAMIATYFLFTVVAETAQSGQAFGRRFNKVWAPIRIIVAFGLLIPLANGLNASQYLVLYAAKFGSGFASNGWRIFNAGITGADETFLGQKSTLITQVNPPDMNTLFQFLYVAATCWEMENMDGLVTGPYMIRDIKEGLPVLITTGTTYADVVAFANGATRITIRIGEYSPTKYPNQTGYVSPICGEMTFALNDPRDPASGTNPADPGPAKLQEFYLEIFKDLWYKEFYSTTISTTTPAPGGNPTGLDYPLNTAKRFSQWQHDPNAPLPTTEWFAKVSDKYRNSFSAAGMTGGINGAIKAAITAQLTSGRWAVNPALKSKGWAGAGIWYNSVADVTGVMSTAVLNIPAVTRYPAVMEEVLSKKKGQDQNISMQTRFEPKMSTGKDIPFSDPKGGQKSVADYQAFRAWQSDAGTTDTFTSPTGNAFIDTVEGIFGTSGLYSMRRNVDAHPLAQLVGVGCSLVEASVRNTLAAGISGGLGSMLSAVTLDETYGKLGKSGASLAITIAMIAMTTGFVLYYIIPFLPFIYFFFAVGGWIKAIFEAMVGAPLWALAHIRIDGNGLPGQAAVNGYFLIFEIFLRPILTVFGLLASIAIFSALILILNQAWDLVTSNLTGFDIETDMAGAPATSLIGNIRGVIDKFFFTVVYAIIAYLMAMSSFKLIDLIPNNILRWIGQSVPTFNDDREDPAQGLVGTAAVGAQQTISSVGGGLAKAVGLEL